MMAIQYTSSLAVQLFGSSATGVFGTSNTHMYYNSPLGPCAQSALDAHHAAQGIAGAYTQMAAMQAYVPAPTPPREPVHIPTDPTDLRMAEAEAELDAIRERGQRTHARVRDAWFGRFFEGSK